MARRFKNGACLLSPNGENGSAKGRVRVAGALYALRCDGIDPWGSSARYADGHEQIPKGGTYFRYAWVLQSDRHGEVHTRHCQACAPRMEEEYRC